MVVLGALATLTVYPQGYNGAVGSINERLRNVDKWKAPVQLAWVKNLSKLQLPTYPEKPFRLGLDLVGGTQLLYDADVTKISDSERSAALEGVRDVIERRVNAFGVAEPLVQTSREGDSWRVLVELAGVKDVNEAIKQIGETPLLEFKEQNEAIVTPVLTDEQKAEIKASETAGLKKAQDIVKRLKAGEDFVKLAKEFSDDPSSKDNGGDLDWQKQGIFVPEFDQALFQDLKVGELSQPIKTTFGYHIIQNIEERGAGADREVHGRHILVKTKSETDFIPAPSPDDQWTTTDLSGKQLQKAQVVFDPQTNQPNVELQFGDEGSRLFEEITGRNVNKIVGIFLDKQLISAPRVEQAITGGRAVITGNFTVEEAKLLVQRLNAGALPVPITLISQETVGASLGSAAIAQSLKAGLYGFLMVALFMLFYYRLPGLVAIFALMIYAVLVLAIFKLWPVTLTLAGIAGFILSIGMAVDANILIFERLKEELRGGKPLQGALAAGFERAWTSIRDSNVSSLITCFILAWFGSSVVKGFALTLAIGIIVSMFSAISITRTILRVVVRDAHADRLWLYGVNRRGHHPEK